MKKAIAFVSTVAFLASGVVASAYVPWHMPAPTPTNTTTVTSVNNSTVGNSVNTSANTGGNYTKGGSATGKNANGGDAVSFTGAAFSAASVTNFVNKNDVEVDACGCASNGDNTVTVSTVNSATVGNNVNTSANTGGNFTKGGKATSNNSGWMWFSMGGTANGGDAGSSTGDAGAASDVFNVVGTNVVRVH